MSEECVFMPWCHLRSEHYNWKEKDQRKPRGDNRTLTKEMITFCSRAAHKCHTAFCPLALHAEVICLCVNYIAMDFVNLRWCRSPLKPPETMTTLAYIIWFKPTPLFWGALNLKAQSMQKLPFPYCIHRPDINAMVFNQFSDTADQGRRVRRVADHNA